MNQLTVNDFFCGCGGMGIGFQKAGYKIVGAWDFDKFCIQSYKENVDETARQEDIKNMTWEDVPKASVWTFGFPCQDLSVAGKQSGLQVECTDCGHKWQVATDAHTSEKSCPICGGERFQSANRSGLFFEIMRLLDETEENQPENMPMAIMAENVKGIRPYIDLLKDEFSKRGYVATEKIFNSKYWGVPQNRERYYIVGTRKWAGRAFEFPEEDTSFVPRLSTALDEEIDEKYYIPDDKARTIIDEALKKLDEIKQVRATITPDRLNKRQNGRRAKDNEDVMFTLTAQDNHGVIIERNDLKEDIQSLFITEDGTAYACTATYPKGINMNDPLRCRSRTLIVEEDPQIEVIGLLDISSHDHSRRVHDPEGLSPTPTAVAGGTHHNKIFDYGRYRVRKLTPTEYGRLQAFPMETWKQVVSDSQAYKQFGNAVTTTVVTAIAENLKTIIQPEKGEHHGQEAELQND